MKYFIMISWGIKGGFHNPRKAINPKINSATGFRTRLR